MLLRIQSYFMWTEVCHVPEYIVWQNCEKDCMRKSQLSEDLTKRQNQLSEDIAIQICVQTSYILPPIF